LPVCGRHCICQVGAVGQGGECWCGYSVDD
jgi:hypothetical protein